MTNTKTKTNTVKMPKAFHAQELKDLQDKAVEQYLKLPGIKFFQVKSDFLRDACKLFADKLSEGYKHAQADYHNSGSSFAISLFKKPEELEAECEAVREQVKAKYEADIESSVIIAKETLIAQRKAHFEKAKEDKKKKEEDALQAKLEKEAAELFDNFLSFKSG